MVAHRVVDLGALDKGSAPVAAAEVSIVGAGPGFDEVLGQILRIDAPIERAGRVAPDLPSRFRLSELFEEPLLLFGAQDRLWRFVAAEIRYVLPVERNRRGGAAWVGAAGVEDFHDFLR